MVMLHVYILVHTIVACLVICEQRELSFFYIPYELSLYLIMPWLRFYLP